MIKDRFNKTFGKNVTKDQIEGRWKTLTKSYRNQKTEQNKTGRDRRNFVYEERLDNIFQDRHDIQPVCTVSSMKKRPNEEEEENVEENSKDEEREREAEGEDTEQSKSSWKGKKVKKSKSSTQGGIACVMKFLQDYTKKQDEKEEQRFERETEMHRERMNVMSGFLDIMKEQMKNKDSSN